jgi:hypothetical protein
VKFQKKRARGSGRVDRQLILIDDWVYVSRRQIVLALQRKSKFVVQTMSLQF